MTSYKPNDTIKVINDITITCYSKKSMVITGNTKPHKDIIKQGNINGRWNTGLRPPYNRGWIIPLSKLEYVLDYFVNCNTPKILSKNEYECIRRKKKSIQDPNYTRKQSIKKRETRYKDKHPTNKRTSKYKTTNIDIKSIINNEEFIGVIRRNYRYSIRLIKYYEEIGCKVVDEINKFKEHKDYDKFVNDMSNLCEGYYKIINKFKKSKKIMLFYRLKVLLLNFGKITDKIKKDYNIEDKPELPTDRIKCKCSTRSFMRKNMNKHNQSKKHIKWLESFE